MIWRLARLLWRAARPMLMAALLRSPFKFDPQALVCLVRIPAASRVEMIS